MKVLIGKAVESKAVSSAITCVVLRTPKNENYKEYLSDGGEVEDGMESYDPELDSPSSWTTKSSNDGKRKCKNLSAAALAQAGSNMILIGFILSGVVYGFLHRDEGESGIPIIFGALLFGAVSLLLVNVSWSFRGKNSPNMQSPCCKKLNWSIPTAQLASSCIVLFVGACLIPTYHKNMTEVLVIVFGIILPLLILVNIPLVVGREEEKQEKDEYEHDVEVVPGNLETISIEIEGGRDRKRAFYKLR